MFTLTYRTHQGKEYQISAIDRTYIYQMFAAVIQAVDCSYAAVTDGFTGECYTVWENGKFAVIDGIILD